MMGDSWEQRRSERVQRAEVPVGAVGTRASDSGACTWCVPCSRRDAVAFSDYGADGMAEEPLGYFDSLQAVADGQAHFVWAGDVEPGEPGEPCEWCGEVLVRGSEAGQAMAAVLLVSCTWALVLLACAYLKACGC